MIVTVPYTQSAPVLDSWLETAQGSGWVVGYQVTSQGWQVELEPDEAHA